jgi:DGQHR domain-containing protein
MPKTTVAAGPDFESYVRGWLKRVGFKDIDGGASFRVGGHQVDACGGWDDVLIVIECTQSVSKDASIHDLISEVRGKQAAIRHGFRKLERYRTYRRFEFAIVSRGIRFAAGDHIIALHKPPVHLIDSQIMDYYQRLASLLGQGGALFNFLGELGVEPRDFDLPRVPALKVWVAKNLPGYLFWCEPQELLKIAYVARRESGREKYYQRLLSGDRLNAIKRFIHHGGLFPNNIIVSFDKKPQFRPKKGYDDSWPAWVDFGELIFPRSYRSCWVIDGQHRLYAFAGLSSYASTQKLAVFAFETLPEPKQAKFFIEINKEQKPVSPDLIWDLEGEMSPDTPEGRIANCVKKLDSLPPLRDRIFLPLSGERKRGQLKMSGFCQDLQATGLLNERTRFMTGPQKNPLAHHVSYTNIPDKVAAAVADFLSHTQECVPDLWESVILRPGGITVALNVYEQVLIRVGQTPSAEQLRAYGKPFAEVLTDLAPNTGEIRRLVREQLTSYAQRRQITEEILRQMQEKLHDPDFGKTGMKLSEPLAERLARFERRLAEAVTERLNIVCGSDLQRRAPEGVWRVVQERMEQRRRVDPEFAVHQALTLGEIRALVERRDNSTLLMPLFTDPLNGFGDSQATLAALSGILRARNAIDHGHTMGNRRLVMAYLETFERLVGA